MRIAIQKNEKEEHAVQLRFIIDTDIVVIEQIYQCFSIKPDYISNC